MMVKVCGITCSEDARIAVACGAGAIGFVFWPGSPRFVDPYRARRIAAGLPPFVAAVGVFVNQSAEYVNGVAALVGLAAVQLHGDEGAEMATAVRRPVIKAIPCEERARHLAAAWPAQVTLLLDAYDPSRRGGTGRTVDWEWAAELATARRVVLSGGLTPDNVAAAVASVKPFGVDVSSGVEISPGVKDPRRVKAFFEALHDSTQSPARS
jgi:phosphoribosylanthranilate isomerase